jgi:hypothetical protein
MTSHGESAHLDDGVLLNMAPPMGAYSFLAEPKKAWEALGRGDYGP